MWLLPQTAALAAPASAAHRAAPAPTRAVALARAWRADPHAPPWARRHSVTAWARMLAGPAPHRWTPRDVNQLIGDWIGVGHWLPATRTSRSGCWARFWPGTAPTTSTSGPPPSMRPAKPNSSPPTGHASPHSWPPETSTPRRALPHELPWAVRDTPPRVRSPRVARRAARNRAQAAAADAARIEKFIDEVRGQR